MAGLDGPGRAARPATAGSGAVGAAALRVSFPGRAGDAGSSLVVDVGADGRPMVDGAPDPMALVELGGARYRLSTPVGSHDVLIAPIAGSGQRATGVERIEVVVDGWRAEVDLEPEARARLRERATSARGDVARGGPLEVRAIIPGRVVSVDVASGDAVDAGGRLLVVEAMKMQNEIRCSKGGTVDRVAVAPGEAVETGALLVAIGAET